MKTKMDDPLLAIDIGNTSTGIAFFHGAQIAFRNRLPTPKLFTAGLLRRLLAGRRPGRLIASTVVPALAPSLRAAAADACGCRVLWVGCRLDLGFTLAIDRPGELGADRICGCAGALELFPPPLIVIDSGTATTFDLINADREYIGGCILPGLEISLRALAENTARLKRTAFRVPSSPVGTNTADQIRAGIFHGFLGTVIHLTAEYRRLLGPGAATVVATGGLSRLFHERVDCIDRHEPDLVFIGLRSLAERNRRP